MADELDAPRKGEGAWGQAIAAVAVVAALGIGLWAFQKTSSDNDPPPPVECSGGQSAQPSGHASAEQLCQALNRPDLAELLGTPGETAKTTSTSNGSASSGEDGKEIVNPSALVEFETYTVRLSASYDHYPVAQFATLMGEKTGQRTVLGRPALLYSDIPVTASLPRDGDDGDVSGPSFQARSLAVALDAKDSGGSLEVALFRNDGVVADSPQDDATLVRVAEEVLPTVPGWAVGG